MTDYSKIMLVGITGKATAGKDTLATAISDNLKMTLLAGDESPVRHVVIRPLAASLKAGASVMLGIGLSNFYDQELKEKPLEAFEFKATPREILQYLGTECMRTLLGQNVWIHALENAYSDLAVSVWPAIVIVPDVRFQNEAEWILKQGGVLIEVQNTLAEAKSLGLEGHASEVGVDSAAAISNAGDGHCVLMSISNNGTLEEFLAASKSLTSSVANHALEYFKGE